jgi:hypothetical protein
MKLKYTFLSGLPTVKDSPFLRRKVTVRATNYYEADEKARYLLDQRCACPPTSWDLELIEAVPA